MGATPAIPETPVPLSDTFKVGCTGSLLVTVRVVERAPVTVGVNVTLIVQLPPAATLVPQPLACAKSPGVPPVSPMLTLSKGAVPVLESVTVCATLAVLNCWFPNTIVGGDTPAIGVTPVPLKVTVTVGFKGSLLLMVKPADAAPAAVGVKVTLIMQLAPTASGELQGLVSPNMAGFAPVRVMLLMVKAKVPVLVSVTA